MRRGEHRAIGRRAAIRLLLRRWDITRERAADLYDIALEILPGWDWHRTEHPLDLGECAELLGDHLAKSPGRLPLSNSDRRDLVHWKQITAEDYEPEDDVEYYDPPEAAVGLAGYLRYLRRHLPPTDADVVRDALEIIERGAQELIVPDRSPPPALRLIATLADAPCAP